MKLKTFKYFYPERPVLMNVDQDLMNRLSVDPDWIAEKKYNGKHLVLYYLAGEFQFWGRHGDLLKYTPDDTMRKALSQLQLPDYTVFDGELRDGKVRGIRNKIVLFDLLIWGADLLSGTPFWHRRKLLERGVKANDVIAFPIQYNFYFGKVFHEVIEDPEIEGLVLKNRHGVLSLGRKSANTSKWMFKVRRPNNSYKF